MERICDFVRLVMYLLAVYFSSRDMNNFLCNEFIKRTIAWRKRKCCWKTVWAPTSRKINRHLCTQGQNEVPPYISFFLFQKSFFLNTLNNRENKTIATSTSCCLWKYTNLKIRHSMIKEWVVIASFKSYTLKPFFPRKVRVVEKMQVWHLSCFQITGAHRLTSWQIVILID